MRRGSVMVQAGPLAISGYVQCTWGLIRRHQPCRCVAWALCLLRASAMLLRCLLIVLLQSAAQLQAHDSLLQGVAIGFMS